MTRPQILRGARADSVAARVATRSRGEAVAGAARPHGAPGTPRTRRATGRAAARSSGCSSSPRGESFGGARARARRRIRSPPRRRSRRPGSPARSRSVSRTACRRRSRRRPWSSREVSRCVDPLADRGDSARKLKRCEIFGARERPNPSRYVPEPRGFEYLTLARVPPHQASRTASPLYSRAARPEMLFRSPPVFTFPPSCTDGVRSGCVRLAGTTSQGLRIPDPTATGGQAVASAVARAADRGNPLQRGR